ncbi:TadE family protein [Ramlibacter sp.]|uniref:TadE/TadG family type IV pilus assembly protein n=1 Tax=Ramlibacter sp. TaxID=1917967 RepID=UPI002D591AC0|nr:TadE family protein [Ramlibacter sp.]HYD77926.1 TadE family protein [Ramlibacter sp.]
MKDYQRGSTAVEFAFVLMLFLTFMLGIVDFSRLLFTWNAANEATRAGARFAAVCDSRANPGEVLAKMRAMLPEVQSITVDWFDPDMNMNTCDSTSCMAVRVRINNLSYRWISPIAGIASLANIPMPTFSTFLIREAMRQDAVSPAECTR